MRWASAVLGAAVSTSSEMRDGNARLLTWRDAISRPGQERNPLDREQDLCGYLEEAVYGKAGLQQWGGRSAVRAGGGAKASRKWNISGGRSLWLHKGAADALGDGDIRTLWWPSGRPIPSELSGDSHDYSLQRGWAAAGWGWNGFLSVLAPECWVAGDTTEDSLSMGHAFAFLSGGSV